ncbi:hypothetical protein INS49_012033 [Diaporthe citri]|uniref:uncharacterized protein n=1 Tax=Diaporthe citri TaxID=83186 RepID=UPI001C7E82C5|nr:uncharacterized protein INS49_012033 [Diaporthe citri]KAG6360965.1 hypothetical protein INS49_012033 [Diaporthe citri]
MMKYIMLLLSTLMGIMLSNAAPVSSDLDDPLANYSIVDLEWIVPISPYRNDTVIGTIQDVANHLAIVDPEGFAAVNESINEAVKTSASGRASVSYSSSDSPGEYGEYDPTDYSCNPFHDLVSGIRIKYGVEYLRKVKGTPGQGPGPASCGRVSCSYNAAIFWCNDNTEGMVLDSYGRIADGAQDLITDCCFIQDDGSYGVFNGVQRFGGNWNVVVQKKSC